MLSNDLINIGVIGIRNYGTSLAKRFAKIKGVQVKTLCDVDENLYAGSIKKLEKAQDLKPSTEHDLRRVFDDKDIDAVVIATPDHWNALAAIWACQAGKHVYIEKPCSHNIWEGRKIIEAAEKYDRIVAVGIQSRSDSKVRQAISFLHSGKLGEVYMVRCLCFKLRESIGSYPDGPMNESESFYIRGKKVPTYDSNYLKRVHYDMWLGPAPKRPFNRNRFHYNWHWFWDYGAGDIGNEGPHAFDTARWGLNKNEYPVKIKSSGGYFAFSSAQQTPNTQIAVFKYADGKIVQLEVRGLYTNSEADTGRGCFFYGSEGWMCINGDGTWQTYFGRDDKPGINSETAGEFTDAAKVSGKAANAHCENFIRALRSGKKTDLTCDIETGHMSTAMSHLANISYRLGVGLEFDCGKEKFINNKEADLLLTKTYRKPFVVPEQV